MAKPGPLSVYPVGAALLAVFGAAVWALSGDGSSRKIARLTVAAKHCGFEDPRFTLKDGSYLINETLVSGHANPPVPPATRQRLERSKLLQTKLMPCLEQAATAIGVGVSYEKTVMVN